MVTPLAGVWVEIPLNVDVYADVNRHSPCGSVG